MIIYLLFVRVRRYVRVLVLYNTVLYSTVQYENVRLVQLEFNQNTGTCTYEYEHNGTVSQYCTVQYTYCAYLYVQYCTGVRHLFRIILHSFSLFYFIT